mgnify:FL=1
MSWGSDEAVEEEVRLSPLVAAEVALFDPLEAATDLRGSSVRFLRIGGSGRGGEEVEAEEVAAGVSVSRGAEEVPEAEEAAVVASLSVGRGGGGALGTTMRTGLASAAPAALGRLAMVRATR